MRINSFKTFLSGPEPTPDKPICFICGRNAELALDQLRKSVEGATDRNVYTFDAFRHGNDTIFSDSERRINSFASFLETAKEDTERGIKSPLFVYDFFDRIDEAIDITPLLDILASFGRQVFIAVCRDYSVEKMKSEKVQIIAARINNVKN